MLGLERPSMQGIWRPGPVSYQVCVTPDKWSRFGGTACSEHSLRWDSEVCAGHAFARNGPTLKMRGSQRPTSVAGTCSSQSKPETSSSRAACFFWSVPRRGPKEALEWSLQVLPPYGISPRCEGHIFALCKLHQLGVNDPPPSAASLWYTARSGNAFWHPSRHVVITNPNN
eukprot:gene9273-biopygen12207